MSDPPKTLDHRFAAWNQRDEARVRGPLERALSPEVRFVDPTHDITGIDAFERMVLGFSGPLPAKDR